MESLNNFFLYDNDYSNINPIFEKVSRNLKTIHESGNYSFDFSCSSINSEDCSIGNIDKSSNISLDSRINNFCLAKMILGTYLSLSVGFKDFSGVPNEWFVDNIDSILSSITSDGFDPEYFVDVFKNGNCEYYCDFLDRKRQSSELGSRSNVQGYKKVLSNAASAFYADNYIDESDSIKSNTASMSTLFFPLFIGGVLVVTYIILMFIKFSK